jgi:glutamine amidotransferase
MSTGEVAVVDYGMGNLHSVVRALETLGARTRLASRPEDLDGAARVVLPGVGAFAGGMANLEERGLVGALNEHVRVQKKPFLGICLGMELLADESLEHGRHRGLGWVRAVNRPFDSSAEGMKSLHIGWNNIAPAGSSPLFQGLGDAPDFYFVHQYYMDVLDPSVVIGWAEYGVRFAAAVQIDNVMAVQFHPEKSQEVGLAMLRRFLDFGA